MAVSADQLVPTKVITGEIVEDDKDFDSEYDQEQALTLVKEASHLLKTNSHLFAYMGNPLLLRAITNRERVIIDKQLDRIFDLVQKLDDFADTLEEE